MAARIPARLTSGRVPAAQGRRFGLTVGVAFLLLAGLLWWREHPSGAVVAAVLGGALGLAGLLMPTRLGPVERAWMGLALAISKVTTPVLMGGVYFLVLTPTALFRRALGGSALRRDSAAPSYWVVRDANGGRRSNLERQF